MLIANLGTLDLLKQEIYESIIFDNVFQDI